MRKSLLAAAATALVALAAPAVGQTPQETPKAQPASSSAPVAVKRTDYGAPDLAGSWATDGGVTFIASAKDDKGNLCVINCGAAARTRAGTGEKISAPPPRTFPKYKPEFTEKVAMLRKEQVAHDPALRCGNPGVPRIGPPHKIMQRPNELIFLYDDLNGSFWRIVPLNKSRNADIELSAMGDSIGRWDGDTLVIETEAFIEDTWLTDNGAFHTEDMKVIERIWQAEGGLQYQATVHDPEVLTEPWQMRLRKMAPRPTELLQPPPCVEQSIDKMTGFESFHDNPR